MVASQTEEVIPAQRRIKMYFDRQSFHNNIKSYLSLLPTILNQNWLGEFFGILDDVKLIELRKWGKFGNFFGPFLIWRKYKPSSMTGFLFSAIWFILVLLFMIIKTIGIVFKVLIWLLILPAPWLLFSITNNIKWDNSSLHNLSQ